MAIIDNGRVFGCFAGILKMAIFWPLKVELTAMIDSTFWRIYHGH